MIERRTHDEKVIVTRDSGAPIIVGHAAVFDKLSENLGGFREQIKPGAFDGVLNDDVRALIDHNPSLILGRLSAGNLKLKTDRTGLKYEVTPTDTTYARDLFLNLEAGNVTQSSFGFQVEDADWDEDEDGRIIRTIKRFKRLFDVSPVTYPAYPDTDVAKRSMEAFVKARTDHRSGKVDLMRREAELLEYLLQI